MVWRFLHWLGIHQYKFHHQAGVYSYSVCVMCGNRNALRIYNAYSPIDQRWLDGGESIRLKDLVPPRGGTSGRKAQS